MILLIILCKKDIGFQTKHYECSVSTCTGKRTGYVFCSMPCFERHLPGARHRDAGAIECVSPSKSSYLQNQPSTSTETSTPTRRIISSTPLNINSTLQPIKNQMNEKEILIVVSKMKQYISDRHDMNTSGDVADILSHYVRQLCDQASDQARKEGRKTVMARDFKG